MSYSLYKELTISAPRRFFRKNRALFAVLFAELILNGLFYYFRHDKAVMDAVIRYVTEPVKRGTSYICCMVPISIAELIWYAVGILALIFIVRTVVLLIIGPERIARLLRRLLAACCAVLLILFGCNLLWGANYYGTGFSEKLGVETTPVSVDDLEAVAEYFAGEANALCREVARDGNGHFAVDRTEIFEQSRGIYDNISAEYGFLSAPERRPKPMLLSELYSIIGFTGFFFPLTAECNLNVHSPAVLLPATIAHEMSHQRGIAPEQDANSAAIITCMASGSTLYRYSAAVLAYIYLGNALYSADHLRWEALYGSLDPLVQLDLRDNSVYWQQYESKVSDGADKVYDSYLHGYDQELGSRSYGACVDLLVAYYKDRI